MKANTKFLAKLNNTKTLRSTVLNTFNLPSTFMIVMGFITAISITGYLLLPNQLTQKVITDSPVTSRNMLKISNHLNIQTTTILSSTTKDTKKSEPNDTTTIPDNGHRTSTRSPISVTTQIETKPLEQPNQSHNKSSDSLNDDNSETSSDTNTGTLTLAICPETKWIHPTTKPIIQHFDITDPYGPGPRGTLYDTSSGDPVKSISSGTVSYSGVISGDRFLTVTHTSPTGQKIKLTYSYIDTALVFKDDVIAKSKVIAMTKTKLLLTARESDGVYFDPQENICN